MVLSAECVLHFARPYNEQEACLRECLGLQVIRRLLKCVTILRQETLPARYLALLFYPKDVFFVDLYGSRGVPPSSSTTSSNGTSSSNNSGGNTEEGSSRTPRPHIIWHVSIPLIKEVRASTHGIIIRTTLPGGSGVASEKKSQAAGYKGSSTGLSSSTGRSTVTRADVAGGGGGVSAGMSAGGQRAAGTWSSARAGSMQQGGNDGGKSGPVRRGEKFYQVPCQTAALTRQIYQELLEAQGSTSAVIELGSWQALQYAKYEDEE